MRGIFNGTENKEYKAAAKTSCLELLWSYASNPEIPEWAVRQAFEQAKKLDMADEIVCTRSQAYNGESLFTQAVKKGAYEVLKALCEIGPSKGLTDQYQSNKNNAAFTAVSSGNYLALDILLNHQVDCNLSRPSDGESLLMQAVAGNHERIVELLLGRRDIHIQACNRNGENAFTKAMQGNHSDIKELLFSKLPPDSPLIKKLKSEFISAAKLGDQQTFVELLNDYYKLLWPCIKEAACEAARAGRTNIVETLYKVKLIDFDWKKDEGADLLNATVQGGDINRGIVRLLVEGQPFGFNPRYSSPAWQNALRLATQPGSELKAVLLPAFTQSDLADQLTTKYDATARTALAHLISPQRPATWYELQQAGEYIDLLADAINNFRPGLKNQGKTAYQVAADLLTDNVGLANTFFPLHPMNEEMQGSVAQEFGNLSPEIAAILLVSCISQLLVEANDQTIELLQKCIDLYPAAKAEDLRDHATTLFKLLDRQSVQGTTAEYQMLQKYEIFEHSNGKQGHKNPWNVLLKKLDVANLIRQFNVEKKYVEKANSTFPAVQIPTGMSADVYYSLVARAQALPTSPVWLGRDEPAQRSRSASLGNSR